jgi:hypothetical protein
MAMRAMQIDAAGKARDAQTAPLARFAINVGDAKHAILADRAG